MPSPNRPGRPHGYRRVTFSFPFFILTLITAGCLFAGTFAFIRFWQRLDPLEDWTKGLPRFERPPTSRRKDGESSKPWFGAQASTFKWIPNLGKHPGPIEPSKWWPEEDHDTEGAQNLEERRPHNGLSSVFGGSHIHADEEQTGPNGQDILRLARVRRAFRLRSQQTDGKEAKAEEKRYPVARNDLAIALPTHKATEPQLRAGRSARLGIRTVVVTNYTATAVSPYPAAENELWTSYPDANPARSFYPGDDRAALAPFLAFRTLGDSFKWLFYGDDDTVFFADAALALASTLDSELPYFVTDNLWWSELFGGAWHPHPQAPRCLPCGFGKNVTNTVGMKMVAGCPCTPALICSLEGGYGGTFANGACGAPRSPARSYSMHGGAGALISIGLLRQIDWESMERCVNHQWSSGGDAFISICLWEQGFAHTTPDPTWHPAGLQMFDPSPPGLNPDDYIVWKAGHILGNLLQKAAGVCQGLCQLEVEHTVTIHLRARRTGGSEEGAAAFVRAFSRLYSRLTGHVASFERSVEDSSGHWMAALATEIDAQQQTAVDALKMLLENVTLASEGAASLDLRLDLGVITADDAMRAGVADALAARLLSNIQKLIAPLASAVEQRQAAKAAGLPGESVADLAKEMSKTVSSL